MKANYTTTLFGDQSHGKYGTIGNNSHNLPYYFLIINELEEGKKKEAHKLTVYKIYLEKQSNLFNIYYSYLAEATQVLTLSSQKLSLYGLCPSQSTNLVRKAWIPDTDCYKYYWVKQYDCERQTDMHTSTYTLCCVNDRTCHLHMYSCILKTPSSEPFQQLV